MSNQANKALVWDFWNALDDCGATAGSQQCLRAVSRYLAPKLGFHGFDPVNDLAGPEALIRDYWLPLQASFPDLQRETFILMGGKSSGRVNGSLDDPLDGRLWVGGTGVMRGTFEKAYLGIPASGKEVAIRWGEFCRMEEGRIAEIYLLLDLVDLAQQAGIDLLPPARGQDGVWPAPAAGDGVMLTEQDPDSSRYSLEHIRRFIFDGLNAYDENNLESMGMADFFHPQVKWFGPGGIGACLDFTQFETLHQAHWLHAFPDRAVQDLDALIAEAAYSGAPGWSGVRATHSGQYLDQPASGKELVINGLDFWKRDGEVYIENWVFVDMIHLFRQMGVDLLARIKT